MAMTSLPGLLPIPDANRYGSSFNSQVIDASGEKAASVFQAPKTGNIDRLLFRTATVTTPQTLQIGLETLDASGDPSGTLYGGSAVGTQTSPASNTQYEVTLGTPAAATEGDDIAAVIQFSSTIGNLQIAILGASGIQNKNPYIDLYTGSWAKTVAQWPCIGVRYDDGIWYDTYTCPIAGTTATAFNVNTGTFDEYGMTFTLPVGMRVRGAWCELTTTAGGDFEMLLYSGTTALLIKAVDGDYTGSTAERLVCRRFGASYDLSANTQYRLAWRPTTANNISIRSYTFNNAAYLDTLPLGQSSYLCKRLNQGAWTDVLTERPLMGLLVDGVNAGGGYPTIGGGLLRAF